MEQWTTTDIPLTEGMLREIRRPAAEKLAADDGFRRAAAEIVLRPGRWHELADLAREYAGGFGATVRELVVFDAVQFLYGARFKRDQLGITLEKVCHTSQY